jgi:aspartyl-tRNA(Asn)/glutamyl-tRNA(Gln) amidotransferase subunit C
MSLSGDDLVRVAKLARLGLTTEEKDATATQLNAILGLIDRMQSVNTDAVEPLAHPLELTQVLRADEVVEQDQRDQYQRVAPLTQDGLYLVPKVVE